MRKMIDKRSSILFLAIILLVLVVLLGFNQKSQSTPSFASDFSWVVGRLEWNPLEGGFWEISFGKGSDPYGGKFVLGNDLRLTQFKTGDSIKITGKISKEQVSIYQAGTIYEITSIEKIGP